MSARWYLVQTRARQEPLAERNLQRQSFDVFLPTELRTVRHARQRRTVRSAFFPGYLFVNLDIEAQNWLPINGTMGVSRLVRFGQLPTAVPDGVVESLVNSRDSLGNVVLRDVLEQGDVVRIRCGPFEGFLGRVFDVAPNDRLKVLLEFMRSATPVEVPLHSCNKVIFGADGEVGRGDQAA
jgi:transcriptional antiterminator RfaH